VSIYCKHYGKRLQAGGRGEMRGIALRSGEVVMDGFTWGRMLYVFIYKGSRLFFLYPNMYN
jgi:hypothetical protein